MIVVETDRGPFRVADIYYAQPSEVQNLGSKLTLNQIIHLRQASEPVAIRRFLVKYEPWISLHVDLRCNVGKLFGDMDRTCRYQVKKAERIRDRIEVRRNTSTANRHFLELHNSLAALKRHTETLSERRLAAIEPFADVIVAYFEGRPVCSHVMLRDEGLRRVGLIWSASTRLNGEEMPSLVSSINRWLHWDEMCRYKAEGMHVYDFGNTGTQTSSQAAVTRFKLSFGGARVNEHNYLITRSVGRVALKLLSAVRRVRLSN